MHPAPENTLDHASRLSNGRWVAGQSPNPGGRPKIGAEVRELARAHTETAITTLVEICQHGKNESARIAAATALLDRGWGKPVAAVRLENGPIIDSIGLIAEAVRDAHVLLNAPLIMEIGAG